MFHSPSWLIWLLPALAGAVGLYLWAARRRRRFTETLGDPQTIGRLVPAEQAGRRRLRFILQAAGLGLLIVALAGPQWGVELVETRGPSRHAVIALDLSLSMMAEDIKPNRLEKAKRELSLLLEELRGDRVGVVAFAGEAAVFCPITVDIDAAKQILRALRTDAIPRPGTAIAKALDMASSSLERYPGGRAIVLLTDGEDTADGVEAVLDAARRAARAGIVLHAIGIGTPAGEPIPLKDESGAMTGYKKDDEGTTVVSRMDEKTLTEAAALTGGSYFRASTGEIEASEIAAKIAALEEAEGTAGRAQRYKNKFMLPLALAFLLLLLELLVPETSKRESASTSPSEAVLSSSSSMSGPPTGALLLAILFLPSLAWASEMHLRKGNRLYGKEEYVGALEQYAHASQEAPDDPRPVFNAGNTLYRVDEFDQAAQAFDALAAEGLATPLRSGARYNQGNAHFQKNDYDGAVRRYRQSLILNPEDPDARHNLAVALKRRKNPPKDCDKPQKKPQDQKKGGDKDKPQPEPQEKKQPQQPNTRPQDRMQEEDAERIMRAAAEKEKSVQKQMMQKAAQKERPRVKRDW